MDTNRDHYRREATQLRKQFEGPKRWKRYCWKIGTEVEFEGTKCTQSGCPERFAQGCMEDSRLVD